MLREAADSHDEHYKKLYKADKSLEFSPPTADNTDPDFEFSTSSGDVPKVFKFTAHPKKHIPAAVVFDRAPFVPTRTSSSSTAPIKTPHLWRGFETGIPAKLTFQLKYTKRKNENLRMTPPPPLKTHKWIKGSAKTHKPLNLMMMIMTAV